MLFNKNNLVPAVLIVLIIALFFTSNSYFQIQDVFPTGMAPTACGDVAWEYCSGPDSQCDGADGFYAAGGACFPGTGVCCRDYAYCGDSIVEGGEQCDGSAGLGTCAGYGYYTGTVICTGACTEDISGCSGTCGDGTCDDGEETCSSCVADCVNETADCSGGQICQNVMGSGTCIAPAPTVCSDTTSVDTCSSITGAPWYCNSEGTLVQNCTACGCAASHTCSNDGITCTSITQGVDLAPSISSRQLSVGDATVISSGGSIQRIDATGSGVQLSWNKVRRNDQVVFEITKEDSPSQEKEQHKIKVNRISRARGFVEVTISSDPIDVVLYEGEPQRVDVDGDGEDDVIVLATNIGLSDFSIDIQEIDKSKLAQEDIVDQMVVKMRERRVFFPEPLFSPVFEDSPKANLWEFIIVNALIVVSMVFFFFRFVREVKKKK